MKHRRRRRVIVEGFQARYVLVQLLWTAGLLMGFACLLFGPLAYQLMTEPTGSPEIAAIFLALHRTVWWLLLGLFACLGAVHLHMAHRVAGPLHRFRAVFKDVTAGRLEGVVRLREGDYLVPEAAELDGMVASLRARAIRAQRAMKELDELLDQCASGALVESEALTGLRAAASALRTPLAEWTTEPILKHRIHEGAPAGTDATLAPAVAAPGRPDKGFSLIELLIVSAIVITVAAMGIPKYWGVLEKARIARAIGDIRVIDGELTSHFLVTGCFPPALAAIGRAALRDPWGSVYEYYVLSDKGGAGGTCLACAGTCVGANQARKDRRLHPVNTDFDLFSMGKDKEWQAPLTAKVSEDDVIRGHNGGFIGLAELF